MTVPETVVLPITPYPNGLAQALQMTCELLKRRDITLPDIRVLAKTTLGAIPEPRSPQYLPRNVGQILDNQTFTCGRLLDSNWGHVTQVTCPILCCNDALVIGNARVT